MKIPDSYIEAMNVGNKDETTKTNAEGRSWLEWSSTFLK